MCLIAASFVVAILTASIQGVAAVATGSVYGTIYHLHSGKPVTQTGDRVLLYDSQGKWFGPSYTDDQGVYTFYNLQRNQFPATIVVVTSAGQFKRDVSGFGKVANIVLTD